MDKQTAVDLLDNLLGMVEDNHDSDYDTAIKMGIDALKEKMQLSKEDATKGTTFDCISRQAAIGAAIDAADDWDGGYNLSRADMIEKAINNLPSAQPERMTNKQWVDFLSAQFDISRTSAKEMLHGMMRWKKEDNFKKMFNGGKT